MSISPKLAVRFRLIKKGNTYKIDFASTKHCLRASLCTALPSFVLRSRWEQSLGGGEHCLHTPAGRINHLPASVAICGTATGNRLINELPT